LLLAYFYSKHVRFPDNGSKPFFFVMGDEAYYPTVNGDHVRGMEVRKEERREERKAVEGGNFYGGYGARAMRERPRGT
jgi:hypothetical protein